MYNIISNIIPAALLIIFLANAKPIFNKNEFNDEYLSLSAGKSVRGFMAVMLICHHFALEATGTMNSPLFRLGTYIVAMFFFYSGYGLQKQYTTRENYSKHFLLKRLPNIIIPYIFVTFFYWIYDFITGERYSLKDILYAIWNGSPVALHSWYVIAIIYTYIAYYIFMKLFKNKKRFMCIGAVFAWLFYVGFCLFRHYGIYWYNTMQAWVLGICWAAFEEQILCFIKKYYILIIALLAAFFAAVFAAHIDIPQTVSVVIVVILANLFMLKVKVGNKVCSFLGEISFEIYIIHGLCNEIFKTIISNDFFALAATIISSVLLAFLCHLLFSKILGLYKKYVFERISGK